MEHSNVSMLNVMEKSKRFRRATLLVVVILFAARLHCAAAQEQSEEDLMQWQKKSAEMYQQVLSPFCPGRSLNDCPSSKAQELKAEMLEKLKAGNAEGEILEDVFQRFGDQYRAIPKSVGFGRLVWLVPGAFVVIGLGVAFGLAARKKERLEASVSKAESMSGAGGTLTSEESEELERELRSLE